MNPFRNVIPLHPRPLLMGLVLAGLAASAPAQDECQVPLFVKQSAGEANVMILADNSGSMNEAMTHDDYNRDIEWSGVFEPGLVYFVAKTGARSPHDFNAAWPAAPEALLVESDNGEDGRYRGNYLNWIYFHATDAQRASVPNYTRIQVLKAVLYDIVDISPQLRMGISGFQGDRGANIMGTCDKNHGAIQAIVLGITANAWTPLGEALEDILDYFMDDGPSGPIQAGCEYNFCVVVTDGFPTMDTDVSAYLHDADGDGQDPGSCASIGAPFGEDRYCSDHFDDVAYWAAHNDLRPDLEGDQVLNTYVIGFDIDAPILQEAAVNGDGLYFSASNAIELASSIQYALQDILRRISSGSAVAVVSTETGTDDRLYRGKFMPVDWNGYLECFQLPYQDGDRPLWDAGQLLADRNPSSRDIFTALGNNTMPFTDSRASTLMPYLGETDQTRAERLILWGRGEPMNDLRDRSGLILGDIIHATPVVVGAPASFHADESFQNFAAAHHDRRKQVYMGANDGMLHAFDGTSGHEEWAFVPEFALPVFAAMADSGYCHRYSCDQTVTVKDVVVGGQWRTVLCAGGGRGGAALFALDVTYPDNPAVMWQQTLPNGATAHSQVQIATVGDRALALVGSGLEESNAATAYLYVYDLADGTLLGQRLLSSVNGRNKCSRPEIVDLDLDGQTDLVYAADMDGSLWRFDVAGSANPGGWHASRLFTSTAEITADPVAAYGPNGDVYVYFGTGAYLTDADMLTNDDNHFVCVFDRHDGGTTDLRDLADQTSRLNAVDGESGWFIELVESDLERVTQRAVVVAQEVIFTSFAPSDEACTAGGQSWLYEARYDNGGGTGDEADQDDLSRRLTELGDGIASYPVVDLATGKIVVQSSDATITVNDVDTVYQRLTVRSWQESYDHVQDVAQTP